MSRLSWQEVMNRDSRARPLVMAHRGSSDDAPENTIAAFTLALAQGAQVLETDLRFSRDDVLVLIHDESVDRTTDGSGLVAEMTHAEIKKLRTRQPLPQPGHRSSTPDTGTQETGRPSVEPPPTLEELLEFTRGETPLALELKDDRFLNARDAARLVDLLARHHALDSTVLVSFSLPRLLTFRRVAPDLRIGMITLSNPLPLFPTEFLGPFFPLLFANPIYVRWARRNGKIVCPLDPAPEPRLGYYLRLGVSILLTNHPARTVGALARWYGR